MSAPAKIEAPSDAQLTYIAGLCEERGCQPPEAVHSKTEASFIIASILDRSYDPRVYRATRTDKLEASYDDVPF